MADTFTPCLPDMRRAKAIAKGGCPHPAWCVQRGECYYGHEPGKVIATRVYKSNDTFGGNVPPHRPRKCSHCGNDELEHDWNYCPICGKKR